MSTSYHWFDDSLLRTATFAFTFSIGPPNGFCFEAISLPSEKSRPFKRRRPLWDVDGSASIGKKKRRLRLDLITSRLSRPYSAPASNIADRGISRIGTWAKGRRPEKNELRKAAIMNRVRHRLDSMKKSKATRPAAVMAHPARPTHSQLVSQLALRDITMPIPRCFESPLPPSPLGMSPLAMSNYDALDLEDNAFGDRNPYGDDEEDIDAEMSGTGSSYYSDFGIIDSSPRSDDGDDYEYLDELDGIPPAASEERPPAPDEKLVEMMKGKERQMEVCFVNSVTSACSVAPTHSVASFIMA